MNLILKEINDILKNPHGDVVQLLDENGKVIQDYMSTIPLAMMG